MCIRDSSSSCKYKRREQAMLNIRHSPRVQPLLVIFIDTVDLLWLLLLVRPGIRLANPDIEEWRALAIPEATHPNLHSSVLCSIGPSTELFFSDVSENWLDLDVTIQLRVSFVLCASHPKSHWSFEADGTPAINGLILKDKIKFRVLSYFFSLCDVFFYVLRILSEVILSLLAQQSFLRSSFVRKKRTIVLTLKSSAAKFLFFTSRSPARSFVFSACLSRPKIQRKLSQLTCF